MEIYNLDAIISVGYRVNSRQATHFRIWATQILKEYIIKGFTMDDGVHIITLTVDDDNEGSATDTVEITVYD